MSNLSLTIENNEIKAITFYMRHVIDSRTEKKINYAWEIASEKVQTIHLIDVS